MTHRTVINPSTKTSTCHPSLVTARLSAMPKRSTFLRRLPCHGSSVRLDATAILAESRQDRGAHHEEQRNQCSSDHHERHDGLNAKSFIHGAQRTGSGL